MWDFWFFFNSILLGIGLAMDAFSVSLANGINEKCMKNSKMLLSAGVFGFFQGLMPMIGWICVHTIAEKFEAFQKFIPWIALALLLFIGIKMLVDGLKNECECEEKRVGFLSLIVQGIATSIDALSVGFTIANHNTLQAIVCALIIAAITFGLCYTGIIIGKKFGNKLSSKASIFGGIILILIGIEIFITGIFF